MTEQTPPQTLDELRQAIDSVDQRLRLLLAERMGYAKAVAAAKSHKTKSHQAKPIYYRPAREAQMLRRLVSELAIEAGDFPLRSLAQVQRELISASIEHQAKSLPVAVHSTVGQALAQSHFGAAATAIMVGSASQVETTVEQGRALVGLIDANSLDGLRGAPVQVVARLPMLLPSDQPTHYVLAAQSAETSGDDQWISRDQSGQLHVHDQEPSGTQEVLGLFATPVSLDKPA